VIGEENGRKICKVGSGEYSFTASSPALLRGRREFGH
jgi:hypothetical protein